MPELPEVETVKRGLEKFILNKKITQVKVLCKKSFISEEKYFNINPEIINIRRFGKALVIDLDNEHSLMIHLRMTGQLIWRGQENFAAGHPSENFISELPNKQTRVIFEFEDGVLYFNDQRKFGFVKYLLTKEVEQDDFIRKLGKEPWETSAEELFFQCQRHKKASIKAVLLDQKVIAGIGNIYADEALFYAGVHPATLAGKLNLKEVEKILLCLCLQILSVKSIHMSRIGVLQSSEVKRLER